jgi:hypothetical protein
MALRIKFAVPIVVFILKFNLSTLMVEAVGSYEILIYLYQTTQCHVPKAAILQPSLIYLIKPNLVVQPEPVPVLTQLAKCVFLYNSI